MKTRYGLWWPALAIVMLLTSCSGAGMPAGPSQDSDAYPKYVDANADGVNDYIQNGTHDPGTRAGHAFVDANGDGICDYAQNGSASWHGPGFVDGNANGICDRWETGNPASNQPGGLRFRDDNGNGVNDYVESLGHGQVGHPFVDANRDGICDRAQNGTPAWHGPGYVDADGDSVPDNWQPGGMGYGGPGNHGPMANGRGKGR